ncbi:MAG: hypothetical protein WCG27_10655, partial [Pseudomonadota bacterium]
MGVKKGNDQHFGSCKVRRWYALAVQGKGDDFRTYALKTLYPKEDLVTKVDSLEKGTNKVFKVVFERLDSIEERITPLIPPREKRLACR